MTPKNSPLSTPTPRRREHIWLPLTQTLLTALALSLSLLLLPTLAQAPTIIRVTPTGSPANSGDSWATATTLTQALTLATAGDEIWVAAGVYTPGTTVSDTFSLVPGVGLYGGFAATETLRTERDWTANLTVLSGDIAGDDTDPDGDGVITTTTHITGSNIKHVVFADGTTGTLITETTILDGFTITAGEAKGGFLRDYMGGGFLCDGSDYVIVSECSPSLSNISFSGNSASGSGGAMENFAWHGNSSPTLNNVSFFGNSASSSGGAMHNDGNSSPTLNNVSFSYNSAYAGGAMVNNGHSGGNSSPTLNNVSFFGNSASSSGGAMHNDGNSSPTLNNVSFSYNSASRNGGAMVNYSDSSGISSPSLNNVSFSYNSAGSGGAMVNYGRSGNSSPTLNNVSFSYNSASRNGGAMVNYSDSSGISSPSLNNVSFSYNSAGSGGAMENFGSDGDSSPSLNNVIFFANSASGGGAMSNSSSNGGISSPSLNNVTFFANSASSYGGAMSNGGSNGGINSPSLNNVILWGNTAGNWGHQLHNNSSATPILSYTLIQSGTNDIVGGVITYGPGILTGDPLFVDADGPDDIAGTPDDDLRLSPFSPAIDAGDNTAITLTTDLAGNPRFYDDTGVADTGNGPAPIVDLGAYERQSNSVVIPIADLSALNDSPTTLGQPTAFTASVTAGNNLVYTWDFGDGNFGSGQATSHTYSAAGSYTATATASNSAGSEVTTIPVTINKATQPNPKHSVYLPLLLKTGN